MQNLNLKYLLIDFGASRIKSAIFDYKTCELSNINSYSSIESIVNEDNLYEVSPQALKTKFSDIANSYYQKDKFFGILICSEMHGFLLVDDKNKPLSSYISWKDERCLNTIDNRSSFEILNEKIGDTFFENTGMKARACYPAFNLFHLIRQNKIHKQKLYLYPNGFAV